MGVSSVVRPAPSIMVELHAMQGGETWGAELALNTVLLDVPPKLPRFTRNTFPDTSYAWQLVQHAASSDLTTNENYLRELAVYTHWLAGTRPVLVRIANRSAVLASGVHFELTASDPDLLLCPADDFPDQPSPRRRFDFGGPAPTIQKSSRRLIVQHSALVGHARIACEELTLQPGKEVTFDRTFHIGSKTTKTIRFDGKLYADNLSSPCPITWVFNVNVERQAVSAETLVEWASRIPWSR